MNIVYFNLSLDHLQINDHIECTDGIDIALLATSEVYVRRFKVIICLCLQFKLNDKLFNMR